MTNEIREMILSGDVNAGERLVETELAATFGTSRGPVRDALVELERLGLVRAVNRRGTFVARLTADDIDEIYALRLALEDLAVTRAVERASAAHLGVMRVALDELSDALRAGDARRVGECDMRFHRTVVEAAGQRRLLDAWEVFADQTLLLMRDLSVVRPELQSDVGAHREILDAFVAGDATRAADAMRSHLRAARDSMMGHAATRDAPEGAS